MVAPVKMVMLATWDIRSTKTSDYQKYLAEAQQC